MKTYDYTDVRYVELLLINSQEVHGTLKIVSQGHFCRDCLWNGARELNVTTVTCSLGEIRDYFNCCSRYNQNGSTDL